MQIHFLHKKPRRNQFGISFSLIHWHENTRFVRFVDFKTCLTYPFSSSSYSAPSVENENKWLPYRELCDFEFSLGRTNLTPGQG